MIKVLRSSNFLYTYHFNAAKPRRPAQAASQELCLAARKDDVAWLWYEHSGHLHFDALHKLCKEDMVHEMPVIKHDGHLCDTCVITKKRRASFSVAAQYRVQKQLELVHGDLCGPVTPAMPGGRRFFLLLVDAATRFM